MLNTVTSSNFLNIKTMAPDLYKNAQNPAADCYRGPAVLNSVSTGRASGQLQAGSDIDIGQCIGHPALPQ